MKLTLTYDTTMYETTFYEKIMCVQITIYLSIADKSHKTCNFEINVQPE